MDLYTWREDVDGMDSLPDTSKGCQFVQQWQVQNVAQEAMLKEMANSELQRLLAHKQTFQIAEFKVGASVIS